MKKIKIIGLGYVGQTLAVVMAESGFKVYGVDEDESVLKAIESGNSNVHETGLNELISKHVNRNFFVGKWEDFDDAEIIVICVPTPVDKKTKKPDLSFVEDVLKKSSKSIKNGQSIILRSTVPIGTTENLAKKILEESGLKAGKDFYLAFAPERTIQGAAIRELEILPQIVGGINEESAEVIGEIFRKITPTIISVSSSSAEAIKLIDNSFRDVKFAYANEIAELCEKVGLNAFEIIRAANRGYHRNNIPIPSPGVGGGCLTKDPYILHHTGLEHGYDMKIIRHARELNQNIPKRIAERLKAMDLKEKKVVIFGFAFKGEPPTNDVRESPTLELLKHLDGSGARIFGHDPVVENWKIEQLGVEQVDDLSKALDKADIAVFMTNHKDFLKGDVMKSLSGMNSGGIFMDGWGLFERDKIESIGLKYMGVGVGDNFRKN